MAARQEVTVAIQGPADPLVERVFTIFKQRVEERSAARVERGQARPTVTLEVTGELAPEAFRLTAEHGVVHVAGGSARGLLYGVGKFLRTSRYEGGFTPSRWRGGSAPHSSLRTMYYATHFHNWYHVASQAELTRYTEDLALWGINTLVIIYPFINLSSWQDPEAEPTLARTRMLFQVARDLGLDTCLGICPNNLFKDTPADLRATALPDPLGRHGNCGTNVCPSRPGGHELILNTYRTLFTKLAEQPVSYLCSWPYDEGGCACEQCRPWGGNGFLRISRDLRNLARQFWPGVKLILSTWTFDTPPEGEWERLTQAVAQDRGWVDYILADSHEDFPRYPLDVGVPGNLPLVNFPEISMWGNWPWGGYGAHVLPARFQRLWNQAKHLLQGGIPYSEGIYEDLNKAIVLQFYWDRERQARDTLREYLAYEFSPTVEADVLAIIDQLEATATHAAQGEKIEAEPVLKAAALAAAAEEQLPAWARRNWRWEILRLRTILDAERYAGGGLETPAAQAAMRRLIEIYHCRLDDADPYHCRVRPPLRRQA